MAIVHACAMAIIHAWTMAIVHACNIAILHVSCPIRLMVHGVEYGGSGGRSPPECRGVWGAASPPMFETNLFRDHFFFDMMFLRGVRGVV